MSKFSQEELVHHECTQMAQILEGIAGTIHEGRPVEAEDLRQAAEYAEWVWQAGPKPNDGRGKEFEASHASFVRFSGDAAIGMAHEASLVERAAQRMALELRKEGTESLFHSNRKELPQAVDDGLARLARVFASRAIPFRVM